MKFSLMWTNNDTFTRPMSKHTFCLRDLGGLLLRPQDEVHLDHVHVIFRPVNNLPTVGLVPGDSRELTLRTETMQLMVRTTPGVRHLFYTEEARDPVVGEHDKVQTTHRSTQYSSSLALTPDIEGVEDYYCRTYRPIRDTPVICGFEGDLSQLVIELIWPLLLADPRMVFTQIPDYRIMKVFLEFSIRFA